MRRISANFIIDGRGNRLFNKTIILDRDGVIQDIVDTDTLDPGSVEYLDGCIVPGFVNAHCHLELSHMKGLVPSGTGLIPFIKTVVSQRDFELERILEAIEKADQEMQEAGIVAVGDISNMTHTIEVKKKSPILYYNFIENFDLLQEEGAEKQFDNYEQVYDDFISAGLTRASMVPHAPYSVSRKMFDLLRSRAPQEGTVSIHNQETPRENDLFLSKTGDLIEFYDFVKIPLDDFSPTGGNSIEYALPMMNPDRRTLLVHNTISTERDITFAHGWSEHVFWCSCPNANLYIENRLPDYKLFMESKAKMCLGTDSLSSNWQLSLLEEMKSISRLQSFIPPEVLVTWATLHGAEALGIDDKYGSIEKGKAPGLNLIDLDPEKDVISQSSKVTKIV